VARAVAAAALAWTLAVALPAAADELIVLCPRGVQTPLAAVAERFRTETGHRVRFVYGTAGGLARRAASLEPADVIVTGARSLDDLIARGVAAGDTRVAVGTVGVGIAVRAGTPLPDVSTPEALRRTLLAAASIGYADPARGGQGGIHFAAVVERLGLTETLGPRTRLFAEGLQGLERAAAGEVALAVAPISEILPVPGLALAGPLPPPLQARLAYAAALLARSGAPDAGRALLAFLAGPATRDILARGGLEPGS
jgi:molybdate transport system substrate-binding protein